MGKAKDFFGKVKSMWSTPPEGRFLCIKEIGALGLYAMGTSAFYNLMLYYLVTVIFIPYYYKIESIHAYGILLIGNFLNMILQPVIGNAMEKTHTKLGKYKPYIIGTLPFLITFTILATLVPQTLNETERIIYAYLTCVPSIFLTNFAYNMYQTMPTVITPNAQERDDVMSPVGLLFGFAPTIIMLIIGPIRDHFGRLGQEYWAIRIFGIVVAVLGGLCMLFVLRLKERVVEVNIQTEDSQISMKDALKMLSKNKPLMVMSVGLCLGSLREFWRFFQPMFAQTRMHENVNMALDIMGVPMTVMGLGVTIAMLIMPLLTRKLNKNMVIVVLTLFNGVCTLILGAVGFQRIPIGGASIAAQTILLLVASIGNGVLIMLPMIIGDLADYQQAKTGKRLEGHIQNFIITIPLLFSQIVMFLLSFLQKAVGFEPSDYSTDLLPKVNGEFAPYTEAQQAIACKWFNIVCIISAVSSFLLIFVMFFYKLSKEEHQKCLDMISPAKESSTNEEDLKESVEEYKEILDEDIEKEKDKDFIVNNIIDVGNKEENLDKDDSVVPMDDTK